jgi:hypothetical protein
MNLRSWSWDHTIGLLVGLITPIVFVPVVLVVLTFLQGYLFEQLWFKFSLNTAYQIKIITIANIANLIWFYIFLNRENWNRGRGVIIASLIYALYVVYIKFF